MYKTASRPLSLVSNSSARMKKMAAPQPPPSFPSTIGSHEVMTSHHSSDDCAINELLEGRMELDVILPDNRKVRMSVERRTPMMDLLVQATTANKINPGGHVIHMWKGKSGDLVHYKPNTPIGSLDSHTIYIVHKSSVIDPPMKKMPKLANKPFEQTFRLQVNLPRNQLMVLRVSPKTHLSEVKQMACTEKRLDPSKYQLVHPNRLSKVLDLSMSLLEYGANEVTLMSVSNIQANICNSATDFIAFTARDEEKKKKGILSIFSKKKSKGSTGGSSEDGPNSRAVSPCHQSENVSRVGTKKRPAPLPPQIKSTHSRSDAVSHSRHSSDSSGYHESSVFSDSPETSSGSGLSSADSTDSHVNGKQTNGISKPTVFQQLPVKKRKAPPPPVPVLKPEPTPSSATNRNEYHVDASPEYDEEEVMFSSNDVRRASISSLGTIDDIENSFEQTIAEAQRVIDMEEEQKKNAAMASHEQQKMVSVAKTDVAALQARLEQDINQQQIHSEIATVFTSVHLLMKDPKEDTKSIENELSIDSQKRYKETLTLPVFSQKLKEVTTSEDSGDEVFERQNHTIRKKSRSRAKRQQKSNDTAKRMDNFTIGSYKGTKDSMHVKMAERKTEHASLQRQTNNKKALSKSESFNVSREEWIKIHPKSGYGGPGVRIGSFLDRSHKKKPNDNKVYGLEGSVRGIKGQVKLRCAEITDLGFSPILKEKSRSMLNLIPEHKENIEVEISIEPEKKILQDDLSIKRALSEHNLSNVGISAAKEPKSEFAKEQERLQCEYMKLEKQFVAWQQQLVSNHTLLEKERILLSSPAKRSSRKEDYRDKCIVFPNSVKPPSRAVLRARESQSLTRRPKSELLSNVTVSTWESQKATEYLTLPAKVTTQEFCGIKSSDRKIDIDAMDFQVKTKQASTSLRSSITKTYFKPPEIRSSSHTRQRLPPEVLTEEENSLVKFDNGRERLSRKENFQKQSTCETALIRNNENFNSNTNCKNRNLKCINNRDKSVTLSSDMKLSDKSANENCSKESVPSYIYFGGSVNNSYYVGLEPQKRNYLDSWSNKETQKNIDEKKGIKEECTVTNNFVSTVPPPPPPPPMPTEQTAKQSNITKSIERKRSVQTCTVDPREELMIEVRKFGGRNGLRKVSNPEASWQLTVFGSSVHH